MCFTLTHNRKYVSCNRYADNVTINGTILRGNYYGPIFIDITSVGTTLDRVRVYNNSGPQSLYVGGEASRVLNSYIGVGLDGDAWSGINPPIGIQVTADAHDVQILGDLSVVPLISRLPLPPLEPFHPCFFPFFHLFPVESSPENSDPSNSISRLINPRAHATGHRAIQLVWLVGTRYTVSMWKEVTL